jgi:hypothetical protein
MSPHEHLQIRLYRSPPSSRATASSTASKALRLGFLFGKPYRDFAINFKDLVEFYDYVWNSMYLVKCI